MAVFIPLFIIIGVLLVAPQIIIGFLVVCLGAGISGGVGRILFGLAPR